MYCINVFYYITIGAMAVKKKLQRIRSTKLISPSEIKSEPIEVIEILD